MWPCVSLHLGPFVFMFVFVFVFLFVFVCRVAVLASFSLDGLFL